MSHRKKPERRQRRGETPPFTVIRTGKPPARVGAGPSPERGWLAPTRRAWTVYWGEGVGQVTAPVDELAIRRLFAFYDAFQRVWTVFLRNPLVRGSERQQVLNPMGRFALQLNAAIAPLEQQFGIGPKARMALGISFAEAKATLEDLAREAHQHVGDVYADEG